MLRTIFVAAVLFVAGGLQADVIDDFDRGTSHWTAHPSDGVSLRIADDVGRRGRAMRLDFDFHQHAGYAIARREVDLDLPANYELTLWMRADAPVNNFEVKLIDASGDNVWWSNRRDFEFPREWRQVLTKKRQISFAWGPLGGGEAKHIAAIELVVTAGSGGKGSVWIDDLALATLPANMPAPPRVTGLPWRGAGAFTFDMGDVRELGGLRIDWENAVDYDVELSRDGTRFDVVRRVVGGDGGRDWIWLPDSSARAVRITPRGEAALRDLVIEPVTWAPTINDFFAAVAGDARRGDYPRYTIGEQSYWTVVGADGANEEALVSEDGSVEPFKAGFSIEPFLSVDGKLLSWADVQIEHSLAEGLLPIPTVTWKAGRVSMDITASVSADSTLYVRYQVRGAPAKLFLAVRPFQVNPSTQFLNTVGGSSAIRTLSYADGAVSVNGAKVVKTLTSFGAMTFDEGNVVEMLRSGRMPKQSEVRDEFGYASGVLAYDDARDVEIAVPLAESADGTSAQPRAGRPRHFETIAGEWREKLTRVDIDLPAAPQIADTIRSSIAYMLIDRDGPALQPGSRAYERAWIRDGALMAPALLRLGHADIVRQFAEWFAPYQFDDGKVPCCVDRRGADPVPENDSHGELIFLVGEYYRYTGDATLAAKLWPHIDRAARYIDALRQRRKTAKGAFYGLVPESISHEGYSAKPVHSYWDDFFCLAGLDDAAFLAGVLRQDDRARELRASAADFRKDLAASIRATIDTHRIDYIPASADLADFDPSATAIAVAPLGLASLLPREQLARTFARYLDEFRARRDGRKEWDVYTPYEMRLIDAFVQRGERAHAHELLAFFLRDRRPSAWNQWAEVVPRDKRAPHFLGDIPHAWIASDFVRAALDLFAFDAEDGTLVVGAGVPEEWVRNTRVHIGTMRTYGGTIDIAMRGAAKRLVVDLAGTSTRAIVVKSPYARPIRRATVNGKVVRHKRGSVAVAKLPATVVFSY